MPNIDLPLRDIENPGDNDVICGRGAGTVRHRGNIQRRKMVEAHVREFVDSNCNREKRAMAMGIIEEVRAQTPPGRFLKKNVEPGNWDGIDDQQAREKISQLFRDIAAQLLRDTAVTIRQQENRVSRIPFNRLLQSNSFICAINLFLVDMIHSKIIVSSFINQYMMF